MKKIISFALILFFTVLGVVGILLPIIPGIPFLLIAALMASRHSPAIARYLEHNRYTASSMRLGKGFMNLSIWGKIRLCFWGGLKVVMDGAHWIAAIIGKLVRKSVRPKTPNV